MPAIFARFSRISRSFSSLFQSAADSRCGHLSFGTTRVSLTAFEEVIDEEAA